MTAETPTSDPSALVRELRGRAAFVGGPKTGTGQIFIAAADLIEQLTARIAELEGERAAIDAFLGGTHGMNEMNVVRGLRKVMRGEKSTFSHEVRLSVYGEWCGHEGTPKHYPRGYGKCADCDPKNERDDDD